MPSSCWLALKIRTHQSFVARTQPVGVTFELQSMLMIEEPTLKRGTGFLMVVVLRLSKMLLHVYDTDK